MNLKNASLVIALVVASSAGTYLATSQARAQLGAQPQPAADNEYQVGAVLFQQKAAEYRALAFQAFNLARLRLDADLEKKNLKKLPKAERRKPRAVVVDVDETVLDNSPHQAFLIKHRLPFTSATWNRWCELREARAIPGAVEFLNYANERGAKVFYVSNRSESVKQPTIDNLRSAGFPDVSPETVMLMTDSSSKEARRQKILETYRIVILLGDNLNDMSAAFEGKSVDERFAAVDADMAEWGRRFIVLPNATYGAWESAIYGNQRLDEAQKRLARYSALVSSPDLTASAAGD